jgi:hypothetical protein
MYNWHFGKLSARNFYNLFIPNFWELYFLRVQHGGVVISLDIFISVAHHNIMQEEKINNWPKYAVYSLIVVVVLLIILVLFLYLIRSPLIFRSSAYTLLPGSTQTDGSSGLSLDNSYIFASPLRAKTGGEKIRITVYILDNRGLGMSGMKVSIGGGGLLTVSFVQPTTDSQGRATFDVSSDTSPGIYLIQAAVDGVNLVQKATISFD